MGSALQILVKAGRRHVRDNAAMSIRELSPAQAHERLAHGAVLIDVREAHERAGGMAEGARGVAKGELQADPAAHLPRHDQEILLICQSGKRSADAAQFLLEAGYTHVASVTGGTVAWREQSLPLVQPRLWSVESLVAAAYRWRDAPRALLPAALLAYGFSIAPILALPYASNALLAAHVALAMRLLDMPAQMFGTVSTPLALNRLRSYAGARRHFWVRALTIGLIAASIALFAASGLVGYLADGLLGGSKWEGVGDVIAIMSLFYCGIALVGPLQEIATLSRQPLWQVVTNALALPAMVGVMLWYGALTPALLVAIGAVSVARTLVHVVFIWLHLGDAGTAAGRDFTAMGARP